MLLDEAKMGLDVIQQMTYELSYVYPRATRSVSIAAPAYYSHHVAFRARAHIGANEDDGVSTTGSNSKKDLEVLKEEILKKTVNPKVHEKLQDSMYFM